MQASGFINIGSALGDTMARAATANAVVQGLSVATGLQSGFNWRNVASAAAGAGAAYGMGSALGVGEAAARNAPLSEQMWNAAAVGVAAGSVSALVGGRGLSVKQLATDAFGNALAAGLVSQTTYASEAPATVDQVAMQWDRGAIDANTAYAQLGANANDGDAMYAQLVAEMSSAQGYGGRPLAVLADSALGDTISDAGNGGYDFERSYVDASGVMQVKASTVPFGADVTVGSIDPLTGAITWDSGAVSYPVSQAQTVSRPLDGMASTLQATAGTPGEVGQTVWSFREASIAQRAFDDGVARQQAMQATQAIFANSPSMTAWDGRSGAPSVTQSHPFYNSFQHSAAISVQDAVGAIAVPEILAAKVVSAAGSIAGIVRGTGRVGENKIILRSPSELMGVEPASSELLAAVSRKRSLIIAQLGSDELRMLDYFGAEASVGGELNSSIILRQDPSKAAVLEEFLHGTQARLGIVDRLGTSGFGSAETHVKNFTMRHRSILRLSDKDLTMLKIDRDKDFNEHAFYNTERVHNIRRNDRTCLRGSELL